MVRSIVPWMFFMLLSSVHVNAQQYKLVLESSSPTALIDRHHPDVLGNRNGFEGGVAFREGKQYHLFVTEEVTGCVQTRTGHWISDNGVDWKRYGTVQESVADSNNARHSIWSPMPVYNDREQRWNLFYVGYEAAGTIHGRVFRAVSVKPGRGGINGPYRDLPEAVLAYTDTARNHWEGVQGTDSFFPFRSGNHWLAFYGSSDAASYWHAGLARADSLEGKWTRIFSPPVLSKAENPIVVALRNGDLFVVYDDLTRLTGNNRIGYAWSVDGLHWTSSFLTIPLPASTTNVRTPQSMIPAGDDTYWIYFTGNTPDHFDAVGRLKVRLVRSR